MSSECPNNHGRQNIVANITADGLAPRSAADVVAVRLKCGCVVGGDEYKSFQIAVSKAAEKEALAIQAARKKAQDEKAQAFKTYVVKEVKN